MVHIINKKRYCEGRQDQISPTCLNLIQNNNDDLCKFCINP